MEKSSEIGCGFLELTRDTFTIETRNDLGTERKNEHPRWL
jgi:hypothetical protein